MFFRILTCPGPSLMRSPACECLSWSVSFRVLTHSSWSPESGCPSLGQFLFCVLTCPSRYGRSPGSECASLDRGFPCLKLSLPPSRCDLQGVSAPCLVGFFPRLDLSLRCGLQNVSAPRQFGFFLCPNLYSLMRYPGREWPSLDRFLSVS